MNLIKRYILYLKIKRLDKKMLKSRYKEWEKLRIAFINAGNEFGKSISNVSQAYKKMGDVLQAWKKENNISDEESLK